MCQPTCIVKMSLCQLPLELLHEICSYVVFDTPESPTPPPLIQIVKPKGSRRLSHRYCILHASTKEIYEHFAHEMIDPVQSRGSMFLEFGTNHPYLSTPGPRKHEEKTLDISDKCGCKGDRPLSGLAGLSSIFSVLVTSRKLADGVRSWLYFQFVFDFHLDKTAAFGLFIANLLLGTKKLVRSIRLTMPIYNYSPAVAAIHPGWLHTRNGFDWTATIPNNVKDSFPNLRALHVNMWHWSRRFYGGRGSGCSGLAAPIEHEAWRMKALEPVLRFAVLPLEEVTVVVDNVWPRNEIWSGDPRVQERRELADWLRKQLLDE
ncbi:hypothetical protein P171DRAFT_53493 [Karstenula rhodostoma CBS 690.94]|uniref:Uncharacterized protein n=1 Tax=Karstenula rhodostoma CBS 690.94 TaxID=1392251 RepID=A0A9P4UAE6_9PLEO|nr:hypothetical protein P171DRAFT_53493 [Karstenula rhodostoma CBS 690.94]